MNRLIYSILILIQIQALQANSDSLYNAFENNKGALKTASAYALAENWYSQRHDSALFFLDYVISDTTTNTNDTLRAFSLKLKGNLYFFKRDYQTAGKLYAKSLKIFEKEKHITGIEETLNNLGIVMIRQDKLEDAINYTQQSLIYTQQQGNIMSAAKTMHNLAYIFEKKGDYESALEYYLKSLQAKRKFNDSATISATLNNIGNIYGTYKDFNKALKYYEQSLAISRYLHDTTTVALRYYNMGRIYRQMHDFDKSMEHYLAALDIYKRLNDRQSISMIYNSLGSLFSTWNKNKQAIDYYKKAMSMLDSQRDLTEMARIHNNIAECYELIKYYQKAQMHYEKAISIFEKTELYIENVSTNQNYALLLIKLKKYKEATKYIDRAFNIATKAKDKTQKARAYQTYADLYYNKKQYKSSLKMLHKASLEAKNTQDLRLMLNIYLFYYRNYKKLNDYKKALYYNEKKIEIKDSIFNQKALASIEELEKKYRLKEKEKEIVLLVAQNKLQEVENSAQKTRIEKITQTRNYAFIGLALFISLLIVSLLAFYTKRKANQKLKQYNAEINEQKEEIRTQRDEIESQLTYIESQNQILTNQKDEITDSITYARYIQASIFPDESFFKQYFDQHFIFYQPKDIVSGDFYFGETTEHNILVAVIDCTGHGVPGAFMSILAYNALKTTLLENKINDPARALYNIDMHIKEATHSSAEISGNGMDIVLINIDKKSGMLTVAGAKRPLIIFRNEKIHEITTTKRSIGGIKLKNEKKFTNQEWQLQKNDMLYMYTDGYIDQFGGENHKKFKSQNFKNLLGEIQNMQLSTQKKILINKFEEWKNTIEQIDDILVLGIKI